MLEKRKHKKTSSPIVKLLFAAIFGFVLTLLILVASNIIEYNLITQWSNSDIVSFPFKYISVFVKRFIHTKELILAATGSVLTVGIRALFLTEKTSIL